MNGKHFRPNYYRPWLLMFVYWIDDDTDRTAIYCFNQTLYYEADNQWLALCALYLVNF